MQLSSLVLSVPAGARRFTATFSATDVVGFEEKDSAKYHTLIYKCPRSKIEYQIIHEANGASASVSI